MQSMQPSNPNNLFFSGWPGGPGQPDCYLDLPEWLAFLAQLTFDLHSVQTFDFHETRLSVH